MAKISIEAKQGVYLSYKNYPYTAPQVFGEYIDNAIQSYEDHKLQLKTMSSGHSLRVDISVEWYLDSSDKTVKAKSITIVDNAAGMTSDIFSHAFNLTDDSITRKGMNEFGIGMKAASAWLGNIWKVESTSLDDQITRTLTVNLKEVAEKQIKVLESEEISDSKKSHGTTITITELWPENVIKKNSIDTLMKNIASIYRYFIRNNEIQIYFDDKLLDFEDYDILKAPSYKNPYGHDIEWKKSVSLDDHNGHTISGFVALLKDMSDEKRGVVFTRNNRVVLGFDPKDRTIGKDFVGQVGSRKYRRVFGELEISGFSVAFGKNTLNDLSLLEALCQCVAGKLKIEGTSILTQADKYKAKKGKSYITRGQESNGIPTCPSNPTFTNQPTSLNVGQGQTKFTSPSDDSKAQIERISTNSFKINGESFLLEVVECSDLDELISNDLSRISDHKLICRINTAHPFFKRYGEPNDAVMALLKALSVSKYKVLANGGDKASEMMNEFNAVLNSLR